MALYHSVVLYRIALEEQEEHTRLSTQSSDEDNFFGLGYSYTRDFDRSRVGMLQDSSKTTPMTPLEESTHKEDEDHKGYTLKGLTSSLTPPHKGRDKKDHFYRLLGYSYRRDFDRSRVGRLQDSSKTTPMRPLEESTHKEDKDHKGYTLKGLTSSLTPLHKGRDKKD